jgi:hypothetical protein
MSGLRHLLDLEPERDVVAHRHVLEERVVLEHEPKSPLLHLHVRGVGPSDHDRAAVGDLEPRDHPEDGALAAAARAQQRDDLSVRGLEGDVVDDQALAEALREVARRNHGLDGSSPDIEHCWRDSGCRQPKISYSGQASLWRTLSEWCA